MTEDNRIALRDRIIRVAQVITALMAIVTFVTSVWAISFGPIRQWWNEQTAWRTQITDALTGYAEESRARDKAQNEILANLVDDVRALSRPRQIFEIADSRSGPRGGYCIERQTCTIDIVIRRTVDGLPCRIELGSTRYFWVEPGMLDQREVSRMDNVIPQNFGLDWADLTIEVMTPANFATQADAEDEAPPAAFFFQPQYSGCLGADDDVVIVQNSPLIEVPIYSAAPDEKAKR